MNFLIKFSKTLHSKNLSNVSKFALITKLPFQYELKKFLLNLGICQDTNLEISAVM